MNLEDFVPTSEERYYTDAAEIRSAEMKIGTRLPAGYKEFITCFGEGVCGAFIRVYPPYQITEGDNSVTKWRERIDEYWFWDEGKDVLSKDKALECVIVADTMDGDELAVHPSEPDRIYVLPRYEECIYVAGNGLMPALEWLLTSGELTDAIDDRTFAPFDGRRVEG